MPEKAVLLITAALGLFQRLVIQNKLPNAALNLFSWNSVVGISDLQLTLIPSVSSACCVVSLYLQFTAHAQMHREKLHVYGWFFSNWFYPRGIKKTKNSTLYPQDSLNWSRSQEEAGETGGAATGALPFVLWMQNYKAASLPEEGSSKPVTSASVYSFSLPGARPSLSSTLWPLGHLPSQLHAEQERDFFNLS